MARLALLALGLLCIAACAQAQQYKKFKEIEGIVKDEEGKYTLAHEEVVWQVVKDKDSKSIFFFNPETKQAQWHDPRGPAPSADAEPMNINIPLEPVKPQSRLTVAVVAMLPVLLFAACMIGRIGYLQIYYPELLWPTKERKDRRKSAGGKFRPQKQRGKLNQDGKGGRSANS